MSLAMHRLALAAGTTSSLQGDALPSASESGLSLDPRCLRAIHLDLLGRPPTIADRARWNGRSLKEFLETTLHGEEFWRNWLDEELYYFLLIDNFRPVAEPVLELPRLLAQGELGVRDALHLISLSASFDRRNPGPDTFVTVVLEQYLGVDITRFQRELEIGKRIYDGGMGVFLGKRGNSQADVVRIAVDDDRMLRHYLMRQHRRIQCGEPDGKTLAQCAERLEQEPLAYPSILLDWMLSPLYEARLDRRAPLTNRLFVRTLFIDLVDRLPNEAEAFRIRSALDGLADACALRSILARLLLDSKTAVLPLRQEISDPPAWIQGLFERLLGRMPTQEESAVFVDAFQDSACEPATVVYALVSHPEYQTY